MEPNLLFGISERQTFFQRFGQWMELLDLGNLLISVGRIEKSRQLLFTTENAPKRYLDDIRIREAWTRSLSTVHPDSSKLIPTFFRPAAFMPVTAPMVIMSMMTTRGLKSIIPQVCLYGYSTAFTIINGNTSYGLGSVEKGLLGAGAFISSTFYGLIPYVFQMKYPLVNYWHKRALTVFFLAQIGTVNVLASRSFEYVRGIKVMDKEGRVIGYSRIAGRKVLSFTLGLFHQAVKETALSRSVLFGTSALIPEVVVYCLLKCTRFPPPTPSTLTLFKVCLTVVGMSVTAPASFGMFPQVGQIKCSKLEEEIRSSTEETTLFYYRGL